MSRLTVRVSLDPQERHICKVALNSAPASTPAAGMARGDNLTREIVEQALVDYRAAHDRVIDLTGSPKGTFHPGTDLLSLGEGITATRRREIAPAIEVCERALAEFDRVEGVDA